ncbi:hypothetical protein B9Z55_007738 [Caenorhabditis nigoni]|uniref:Uncharacterized protein n=1 Tax=Caenorhabditis nigoni TaxID=1611254 RepID=A0A2G5VBP1_9PELO|nr:hypothetical protein B9Z55_007738 [Caenorhabditis nigoni]
MDKNNDELGKDPKIDSKSKKSEILEKMNSQEQKIDEMAEKLQSIKESIAKIPKFDEKRKSEKRFVLKHVFENVNDLDEENRYMHSEEEEHFNMKW